MLLLRANIYTHYFSLAAAGSKGEGEIEIKSNKIELIRSEKICPFIKKFLRKNYLKQKIYYKYYKNI